MQKIFFVEDDDGINFIIKKTLDNSNFKSEGFKKGLHFIEKFKEEKTKTSPGSCKFLYWCIIGSPGGDVN